MGWCSRSVQKCPNWLSDGPNLYHLWAHTLINLCKTTFSSPLSLFLFLSLFFFLSLSLSLLSRPTCLFLCLYHRDRGIEEEEGKKKKRKRNWLWMHSKIRLYLKGNFFFGKKDSTTTTTTTTTPSPARAQCRDSARHAWEGQVFEDNSLKRARLCTNFSQRSNSPRPDYSEIGYHNNAQTRCQQFLDVNKPLLPLFLLLQLWGFWL